MWKLLGVIFALLAAFFAYYTVRLIYINLTVAGIARRSGMYIGFVAFPALTIVFGWLSARCWRHSAPS